MTLANPFATKTDGVSKIPAAELNAAGESISRAVDGTGGGAYAPSSTIQINGAGLYTNTFFNVGSAGVVNIEGETTIVGDSIITGDVDASAGTWTLGGTNVLTGSTTVSGNLSLTSGAPLIYSSDTPADADATISPTYHTYFLPQPSANRILSFNAGAVGQRLRCVRTSSGAFTWSIRRAGSGNNIAVLDASQYAQIDIQYTSGGWRLVMMSPNVTVGSDA